MLFLEHCFGFCWCFVLAFFLFINIYKGQIKLQSHNFGREGVIQSSLLLKIDLIRASISRHIQQRHTTLTRAHNLSGKTYLFFNHPRVLGFFSPIIDMKAGNYSESESLRNAAFAVLGTEFTIAMPVINVY